MPTRNPAGLLGVAMGLLFLAPATLWLGFLGWRIVRKRRSRGRMRRARGIVVGHDVFPDADAETYRPRVRFTTDTNREVEVGGVATPYKDALGTELALLYDPEQPEAAQLDRWKDQWLLLTAGLLMGAFVLLMGFFILGVSLAVWYFDMPTPPPVD